MDRGRAAHSSLFLLATDLIVCLPLPRGSPEPSNPSVSNLAQGRSSKACTVYPTESAQRKIRWIESAKRVHLYSYSTVSLRQTFDGRVLPERAKRSSNNRMIESAQRVTPDGVVPRLPFLSSFSKRRSVLTSLLIIAIHYVETRRAPHYRPARSAPQLDTIDLL